MAKHVFPWHLLIAISKHEMSMSDRWKKLHLMLKCVNRTHCLLPNMHLRTLCSVCYHGCGVHCKTIPSCVLEAAVLCCAVQSRNVNVPLTLESSRIKRSCCGVVGFVKAKMSLPILRSVPRLDWLSWLQCTFFLLCLETTWGICKERSALSLPEQVCTWPMQNLMKLMKCHFCAFTSAIQRFLSVTASRYIASSSADLIPNINSCAILCALRFSFPPHLSTNKA